MFTINRTQKWSSGVVPAETSRQSEVSVETFGHAATGVLRLGGTSAWVYS
jgi:hypothetical protein